MQKKMSKQKGRINKNQNKTKTKICKGSSRWKKCMLLPLVQGLTVSKKYLIGKFAAKTHIAMGQMYFSLHTVAAVVILLTVLKA